MQTMKINMLLDSVHIFCMPSQYYV